MAIDVNLANIGDFTHQPQTELLVAADENNTILGAVIYFNDMKNYGSGGIATQEQNSAGFRLLGVAPTARGKGIGKLLTQECIQKAADNKRTQLIIHSTLAMKTAWEMYEKLGFNFNWNRQKTFSNYAVGGFFLPKNFLLNGLLKLRFSEEIPQNLEKSFLNFFFLMIK